MTRATTTPKRATKEVTYEEYMAMPETNQFVEVVDGVIVEMAGPTVVHQVVSGRIYRKVDRYVEDRDLGLVIMGPADVLIRELPKLRIRQPDVMFFSDERAGFRVTGDPDRVTHDRISPSLAVEVLSPGQNERTLADKLADYASIQVEEVWFADQETRTIRVLAREGGGYRPSGEFGIGDRVVSAVLPGIDLDVAAVFA
ncbi:MAG: hypothetical protein JWN86_3576 [Planctomycetota bacterium]|nr:hypothetical protein [Planctomycetota bacterium]